MRSCTDAAYRRQLWLYLNDSSSVASSATVYYIAKVSFTHKRAARDRGTRVPSRPPPRAAISRRCLSRSQPWKYSAAATESPAVASRRLYARCVNLLSFTRYLVFGNQLDDLLRLERWRDSTTQHKSPQPQTINFSKSKLTRTTSRLHTQQQHKHVLITINL